MRVVTARAMSRVGVLPHIIRKSSRGEMQKLLTGGKTNVPSYVISGGGILAAVRPLYPKLMITACLPRGVDTARVVFTRGRERERTRV